MTRRVVISGMGTVNPLAKDVPHYWRGLLEGRSGIGPILQMDTTAFRVHFGGEVKEWKPEAYFDSKSAKRLDRYAQFALAASIEAIRESGLDFSKEDPFRCGCILGSGIGGLNEFEDQHDRFREGGPSRVSPFVIPKMMGNSAPGLVSIHYGLCGPCTAVATACASAANGIADALRCIQRDEADVMVTGGCESTVTNMGLGGFTSARALSTRNDAPEKACRPWDKDRDGFVLAEGAGVVVIEEYEHAKKRGAPILAELLGAGYTADAYNITAPHPEGIGAARAVTNALRDSRIPGDAIDYVNAHGTGTDLGDIAETRALKKAFGPHAKKLAISSTKSMCGHLLGASGGIELIASILSIKHGVVHPTINLEEADAECDLDYVPKTARQLKVRYAISNSFGFGGHNASLVVGAI